MLSAIFWVKIRQDASIPNRSLKHPSLLAEAIFLVFADGRKETSAMGRKWLNRRPQSWTALFKTHAPCEVR